MVMLRPETEMKDSGITYIGDIPCNWSIIRLKYLVDCLDGMRIPIDASLRKTGPYPYWGAGKIMDYVDNFIFDEEIVLLGEDGAPFFDEYRPVSHYVNEKVWVNNHIHVLRPKGINPHYLVHSLNLVDYNNYINGSILSKLTQGNMMNIVLPLAPLSEQQVIADYLDDHCSKIDAIIAEATASIEEYKALKQAVLFETVTKGLDKNVPMKDSGVEWLGQIPDNWALVRIPRILDYRDSYPLGDGDHGMIKTEDYQNEGIPYIRVQNLGWGTDLLLDNVVYISETDNEKIKSSQLKPNDVLFCKTGGTIGKTGMVPENLPISNTTSHVGKITVNPAYNSRYVFYVLSSNVGYRQFWEIACQKTTRPELSIAETRQIRLTWPSSRKEQDAIVAYLDAILPEYDSLISEKQSLIEDLQAYKKSLIYEVVTGKRRVV